MPYCVQQKQSPIDSVRTTINSSPLEAIRDHLWLLRARREREREDGGERWSEQRRRKKMKRCRDPKKGRQSKRLEEEERKRKGKGAMMERDNDDHRWKSLLNIQFPPFRPTHCHHSCSVIAVIAIISLVTQPYTDYALLQVEVPLELTLQDGHSHKPCRFSGNRHWKNIPVTHTGDVLPLYELAELLGDLC